MIKKKLNVILNIKIVIHIKTNKHLIMFIISRHFISLIPFLTNLIISINFIFAGFCIVAISVFQAVGKGLYSLWISIARQLVVLIPVAYLMSLTGNLNNIWLAFPIAELTSVIVALAFLKRVYRKIINSL